MAACFFFLMVVGLKLVSCDEAEVSKSSLSYYPNSQVILDPSPPENDPESFRPTTDKSLFQKWVKKRRKKFSSITNIEEISHANQLNIFSPFGNKVSKRKKLRNHEFVRSKRFNINNAQHQRGGSRKSFSIIRVPEMEMFLNDYANGQQSLQNTKPSEFYNNQSTHPSKTHPLYSPELPVTSEPPRKPHDNPQHPDSTFPIGSSFFPGLPSGIHSTPQHHDPLFSHGSSLTPESPRKQHEDTVDYTPSFTLESSIYPPEPPGRPSTYPSLSVESPFSRESPSRPLANPQLPYPSFTVGTSLTLEPSLNPPIDDSLTINPSPSTDHEVLYFNDFRENPTQMTKHISDYTDLFPKFTFPAQSQIPDSFSIAYGNVTEKPKTFLVFDRNGTNLVSNKNSFQTSFSENINEQNNFRTDDQNSHNFPKFPGNSDSFLSHQPQNNFHSEPTNGMSFIAKNSIKHSQSTSTANQFQFQNSDKNHQNDFVKDAFDDFHSQEPIQLKNSLLPELMDNIYPNSKKQLDSFLTVPSIPLDMPITNQQSEKFQFTSKFDPANFLSPTMTSEQFSSGIQLFDPQILESPSLKQNNNILDENINNFYSHDDIHQQITFPTISGRVFNEHPDEVHSITLNIADSQEPRSQPAKVQPTSVDFLNLPSGEPSQTDFQKNSFTNIDLSDIFKSGGLYKPIPTTESANYFSNFPDYTTESTTTKPISKRPLSTSFKIIKLNSISLDVPDTQIKPTVDEACLLPGQRDCKSHEDKAVATDSYPALTDILEHGGSEISNLLNGNLIHAFRPPTVNPQLTPDSPHFHTFSDNRGSSFYRLADEEEPTTNLNAVSMPPSGKLRVEPSNFDPPKFRYFETSGSGDFTTSPSSSHTRYSPTPLTNELPLKKILPQLPPLLHLTPFEPRPPPPTPPQIPKRIPIHPTHKFTLITPMKYMSSTTEQINTSLEPPLENNNFPSSKDHSYLEVNEKENFPNDFSNRKPRRPLQNHPTPPPSYFPLLHRIPSSETVPQFEKRPLRMTAPFTAPSASTSGTKSHFNVFSIPSTTTSTTTTTTPSPEVSVVFDPKHSVRNSPMVIFTPPRPVFPPPPPFIDNKGHEQDPGPLISEISQQGHRFLTSNLENIENSKEELPKRYEYRYIVNDPAKSIQYGHAETREGPRAKGEYFVTLPDGRTQLVKYILDENGYRADVKYYENSLPVVK